MTQPLEFRNSRPVDLEAVLSLYPEAFPDEDLLPLVRDLLSETPFTTSIIAEIDSATAGHAIFTNCSVTGTRNCAALLGPLVVSVERHGQGIGSALVRKGLQQMKEQGVSVICVLGDPAFYNRLGFLPESKIRPPYDLPPEYDGAWQSLKLTEEAEALAGKLLVPPPWQEPSLWLP